MSEFTEKEIAVLKTMHTSMGGNGFDFGFADDCRPEGMTVREAQGTLRALHKKLKFYVDDEFNQLCCTWPGEYGELSGGSTFEQFLAAFPRQP